MSEDEDRFKIAQDSYVKHTGKPHDAKASPDDPPSMQALSRMSLTNSYTDSWARTELDLRTKCFLSMAITATLGTEDQFKAHLRAAHHSGVTKDEIVGMLMHFLAYLGAPRTSAARRMAREVWKEMRVK